MFFLFLQGEIWDQLHYPNSVPSSSAHKDDDSDTGDKKKNEEADVHLRKARKVFELCGLEEFIPMLLNTEKKQIEELSSGEKQCLSVARLLFQYTSGNILLLDEITSAVDESTEERLYSAIVNTCDTFISVGKRKELLTLILLVIACLKIGHRSTIKKFHTHQLELRKDGSYAFHQILQ
jgi:ABC-type uncharacterized transport system fused permease/ATPase subunit